MAGESSQISLAAIGPQDAALLSDKPEDLPFFYDAKPLQHSNFRKFHKNANITNPNSKATWPFGESIKVKFNPTNMGDLLSNMWVSFELPAIANGNYADQIGRHIFERVTMYVDELEIETVYDDWMVIHDEMFLEPSEKVANRFLVNRSLAFDTSELNETNARHKSELFIPIPFFFSRKYAKDEYSDNEPNRPYFPLAACWKQKIEFEFVFRPQTFFTDFNGTLSLSQFDIITEQITLDPLERMYFMKEEQTLVTDIVRRHPTAQTEPKKTILKTNLVPNVPVKSFFWFFRRNVFEDPKVIKSESHTNSDPDGELYIHNRFNFSSNVNFDELQTFYAPVMDLAKFHLNGSVLPNSTNTGHVFYKYLQPTMRKLSRPIRNIYTYSFSANPVNVASSGYLDFSQIQGNKTNIEFTFEPINAAGGDLLDDVYTFHMFYLGYEVLKFNDGKIRYATERDLAEKPKAKPEATEIFKSYDRGKTFVLEKKPAETVEAPPTGPRKPREPNQVDHFLKSVKRFASM